MRNSTINKPAIKKNIAVFLALAVLAFSSCAGGASVKDGGMAFADIEGKEWTLVELKNGAESVSMDRQKFAADGFEGVYTITFDAGRVRGMGAPNRYLGPYTLGEGKTITIGNVAGTLMAPLKEPEELKEHEYFALLGKVSRWDIRENRLELFTIDADGNNAVLIFR
jgi:heat shock protein HslJ